MLNFCGEKKCVRRNVVCNMKCNIIIIQIGRALRENSDGVGLAPPSKKKKKIGTRHCRRVCMYMCLYV